MSLKVANSGRPIGKPLTCFEDMLLNLKVHSVVFSTIFCFNSFKQTGVNVPVS